MGTDKIKQQLLVGFIILLLIVGLVVGIIHNRNNANNKTLTAIEYTNSISGTTSTYYANKAPEVQATGPSFVNSDMLAQQLGDAKFTASLSILRSFVEAQSHFLSRQPVLSKITTNGSTTKLSLFIDSSEQFYDVTLSFANSPTTPTVTYKVDPHESVQ